jgi:hypothetical protein
MLYNLNNPILSEKLFYEDLFPKERNKKHFLRYKKFINSRKYRKLPGDSYCEIQHILPQSFCPKDWTKSQKEINNIITLSAREHFIAHLILWKAFPGQQMALALHFMRSIKKGQEGRYFKLSSKQFTKLRQEQAEISRQLRKDSKWMRKNGRSKQVKFKDIPKLLDENWELKFTDKAWNKGIPHKEITKERMSISRQLYLEKNELPTKGIPLKESHKENISKGLREFYDNNESPLKNHPRKEWVKKKLSSYWVNYYKDNDGVNKGRIKINKEGKDKLIYPNQLNDWIEDGWNIGSTKIKCYKCGKLYTKIRFSSHKKSCF